MTTQTTEKLNTSFNTLDTFKIKGEKFVVLKKDYLDEIVVLMKSFMQGENLLGEKRTRTFSEFLKSISKKKKQK